MAMDRYPFVYEMNNKSMYFVYFYTKMNLYMKWIQCIFVI